MKNNQDKNTVLPKKMPRFHAEMEGRGRGMSFLLCGVRCIEEYNEEMLTIKIPGGRMHFKGTEIFLSVFENKTVEVCGRLLEVRFSYDRN